MEAILEIYTNIMATAAPIALVIWVADMLVTTLMTAINGGYLRIGRAR